MTEPSEEMKAMARRIAAEQLGVGAMEKFYHDGTRDDTREVQLALAAIIETQRADAELAAAFIEREGMTTNHAGIPVMAEVNQRLATAIRTGNHYRKDESHD